MGAVPRLGGALAGDDGVAGDEAGERWVPSAALRTGSVAGVVVVEAGGVVEALAVT